MIKQAIVDVSGEQYVDFEKRRSRWWSGS